MASKAGGMIAVAAIAAGGALGAVARHASNIAVASLWGNAFPWGTLIVNIAGSFVMGIFIGLFAHFWQPSHEIRSFLTVGLLGGFTTFSSFSLDAVTLFERGDFLLSALYIAGSVIISISALFLGLFLIRMVA